MRRPPVVAPDVTRLATSGTGRLEETDPLDLGPREDYELLHVVDGDISRDLSGIGLTDCRLERLTAHGAVLTGARLTDTMLVAVTAPSLAASRMSLQDVVLRDSRLGAAEMFDGAVRGLIVEGCRIDFLNLRGSTLTDVLFPGLSLRRPGPGWGTFGPGGVRGLSGGRRGHVRRPEPER